MNRKLPHFLQWATVVLLLAAVSGCGFQLRGAFEVPDDLRVVYVSGENTNSAVLNNLRRSMLASGVKLVDQPSEAPYTLHLSNEHTEKRAISVDSLAAAAEFQLRQFVSYELRNNSDQLLIGPREIISERNFQNDITNVVGKRDEERLIRQEMQAQLASRIMRRYQAIDVSQLAIADEP